MPCWCQAVFVKSSVSRLRAIYMLTRLGSFMNFSYKIKVNFTKKNESYPCLILSFLCYLLSVQTNIWQEAMATRRKFGTLSRNCPRSKIWRPHGHQKSVGNILGIFPFSAFFLWCEFDQVVMLLTLSHPFPWPWPLCLFCPTKSTETSNDCNNFFLKILYP